MGSLWNIQWKLWMQSVELQSKEYVLWADWSRHVNAHSASIFICRKASPAVSPVLLECILPCWVIRNKLLWLCRPGPSSIPMTNVRSLMGSYHSIHTCKRITFNFLAIFCNFCDFWLIAWSVRLESVPESRKETVLGMSCCSRQGEVRVGTRSKEPYPGARPESPLQWLLCPYRKRLQSWYRTAPQPGCLRGTGRPSNFSMP